MKAQHLWFWICLSPYTNTNESVVMLALYSYTPWREAITTIKVFGVTRPRDHSYHRRTLLLTVAPRLVEKYFKVMQLELATLA